MRKLFGDVGSALSDQFSAGYIERMNLQETDGYFVVGAFGSGSDWYAMLDMGGEL